MARGDTLRWSRALLRFFNFVLPLIALATLSRAFVGSSYYGYSSMLGSRAATYTTLVTYTGMLVGLFFLLFVELMRFFPRPAPRLVEQLIDFILAAMLVVAGIVLVVSDYVANCSVYGYMLRCNQLKTAVVFTFLASFSYFVTFLLDCCEGFMGETRTTATPKATPATTIQALGTMLSPPQRELRRLKTHPTASKSDLSESSEC